MPHSYSGSGMSKSESENKVVLKAAEPKIEKIVEEIKSGKKLSDEPLGKSWISKIANPMMYMTMMSDKKFYVANKCISCGSCEKNCPLGNIRLTNGKTSGV